jgi:uncharacterized membrane protein YtjA (UPF0391 family)
MHRDLLMGQGMWQGNALRGLAVPPPALRNRRASRAFTAHWTLPDPTSTETHMLGWALTFLVVALIAAVLGFSGIAGASAGIAQILFFIFIVLFVVAMIARAMRGQPPV